MNILELAASISLDSSGLENGLSNVTGKIKSVGSKIATAGAAISGAAAAGVTAITKMAVDGYADYEQLVGGVETLFGTGGKSIEEYAKDAGKSVSAVTAEYQKLEGAQNTLMQNAANAFKTAGLSANDYMETATSFAASLVSSCGGNTQKAAEMADTAITDMSDNANKMGTDMTSIQNAYQGFAKQNYVLLDNLKLGYGGTKEEMERLIEDANELEKAQGKAGDLTIDSYADIVTAIHDVQENMGITGTTSKEAATTIQGSLAMTKSAWSNLVTGMATDGADVKGLTGDLIESASAYADNLIPRITQAFQGLGEALTKAAPDLITKAGELVSDLLPGFVSGVANLAGAIISALPELLKSIWDTIPTILESVDWAGIWETIKQGLASIDWAGIWETIKNRFTTAVDIASSVFTLLQETLTGIDWGAIATTIWDALKSAFDTGVDIATTVYEWIVNALSGIDWAGIWDSIQNAGSGIGDAIINLIGSIDWAGIWETIKDAFGNAGDFVSDAFDTVTDLINQIDWAELGKTIIQLLGEALVGALVITGEILAKLIELLGEVDWGELATNILEFLASALLAGMEIIGGAVEGIFEGLGDVLGLDDLANDLNDAWSDMKSDASEGFEGIKSKVSSGLKSAKNKISDFKKEAPKVFKDAIESINSKASGIKDAAKTIKDKFEDIKNSISDKLEAARKKVKEIIDRIKGLFDFSWSLPTLKVPHISVDGGEAPWGIGGLGHLPSFDVTWAAKGGILDGATLVGAGEAGKEALLPLERNTGWMDTLADRISSKGDTVINVQMTVNGSESPEEWGQRFIGELNRQVRMGVV